MWDSAVSSVMTPVPTALPQRATPCLTRLTAARTWDPTLAVRVGSRVVGVRATQGWSDTLNALFRHLREPGMDDQVSPNFSVELAQAGSKALNLAYRDHVIMARRRRAADLLDDLYALVTSTAHEQDPHHLAVRATALTVDDEAVLLPPAWHAPLLLQQERLADRGLGLLAPLVHLVTPDRAALARSDPDQPDAPITTWGLRVATGDDHELRPAEAIHLGFFMVANVDVVGARATLDILQRMTERAALVGLRGRHAGEHVRAACELARRS